MSFRLCKLLPFCCPPPDSPPPRNPFAPEKRIPASRNRIIENSAKFIDENTDQSNAEDKAVLSHFALSSLFLAANCANAALKLTNQIKQAIPEEECSQLAKAFQFQAAAYNERGLEGDNARADLALRISKIYASQ